MKIPSRQNFRMPAEWESHQGTWLTWPRSDGISFPDQYETIPPILARFITELTRVEEVYINVWNAEMEAWVRRMLTDLHTPLGRVFFHHFPSYEPWCRDHGPVFLVRDLGGQHERAVVDWGYNAWGAKYPPYDLDDAVPQHVAKLRGLPLFSPPMILEGGSIEVNGAGTLLTTESCLLNPNRNPNLSKSEIEQHLRDFLGVTKILWLGEGIAGDDTDGHIDTLARFVNPTTIVIGVEEDIQDANYHYLQENWRLLRMCRDQDERLFRVVKLPMPGMIEHHGQRLPATYMNFYIANGLVIVPTFGRPSDGKALEILRKEMPDHNVVGLDSLALIWGLGSFHCLSQQEPA
jgi:agmatine deiminase